MCFAAEPTRSRSAFQGLTTRILPSQDSPSRKRPSTCCQIARWETPPILTKRIISLKNHLSYLLISVAIFAATSVLAEQAKPSPAPSATPHLKYTCVMHPEIMRDQPGNCPKCGMKLVPVHSSRKTEPRAHSHGQSSPGHRHGWHGDGTYGNGIFNRPCGSDES